MLKTMKQQGGNGVHGWVDVLMTDAVWAFWIIYLTVETALNYHEEISWWRFFASESVYSNCYIWAL